MALFFENWVAKGVASKVNDFNLRYPKFFEETDLATHNILNHTFLPRNKPKFQTTLLYARNTDPEDFIRRVLAAKTDEKAVTQFEANHYTFLATGIKGSFLLN